MAYLRLLHVIIHDFNEFLPPSIDVKKKPENCSTFFMTLDLYGLPQEYVATVIKITSKPYCDFCIIYTPLYSSKNKHGDTYLSSRLNTFVASHSINFEHSCTNNSKNCPKYKHYHCVRHSIDKCGKLHEKLPRPPNIV